jgi:hypothetical protein
MMMVSVFPLVKKSVDWSAGGYFPLVGNYAIISTVKEGLDTHRFSVVYEKLDFCSIGQRRKSPVSHSWDCRSKSARRKYQSARGILFFLPSFLNKIFNITHIVSMFLTAV